MQVVRTATGVNIVITEAEAASVVAGREAERIYRLLDGCVEEIADAEVDAVLADEG